jgi:hypothetical protein
MAHPQLAVPASVEIEDLADLGPQIAVLIDGLESPLLIVEATSWQTSSAQQTGEREMRPQLDHDQRPFTGAERFLVRIKACAFFR